MPIDKNQVKKVAKLSRISLEDNKIDSLSKDLDSILTFVEKLNELDTKEIKTLKTNLNNTWEDWIQLTHIATKKFELAH